jgi:hypothetical protein
MSYTIRKTNGTAITVPDNTLDLAYYSGTVPPGVGYGNILVGRNTTGYGAAIAQNFLQMQENFANTTPPVDSVALQGQLWFEATSSTSGNLYVRVKDNPSGGIANWGKLTVEDNSGNLVVGGRITSDGNSVPVVYTSTPASALPGDIRVLTSPSLTISIYGNGTWNQIFPAVYS